MEALGLARSLGIAVLLAVIAVIDVRRRIVPDGLVAAIVGVQAAYELFAAQTLAQALRSVGLHAGVALLVVGVVLGACVVADKVLASENLGGGDVKLIGALAFVLGLRGLLVALFAASLAALAGCAVQRRRMHETFPFCPYLGIGCLVAILGA